MILDDNLDVWSLAKENGTFCELKSRYMAKMRMFEILTILTCIVTRIMKSAKGMIVVAYSFCYYP
jgi:hypothetical protein